VDRRHRHGGRPAAVPRLPDLHHAASSSFVPQGRPIALQNLSLVNFERFLTSPLYQRAFVNSLVVSLSTTLIATLIALPAAFAMARVQIPAAT
jgi:iron(III) transport system permease protein